MYEYSRRAFLVWLGACGPGIVAAHEHARRALDSQSSGHAPALRALSPQQAIEVEAIAAQMLAEYFNRTMYVLSHTTALPLEENSVSLDPEVKDAWGLPALRVTFKNHPDDLKCMQFLLDRRMEVLEAAGARRTWAYPVEDISFSVHLMGTCRMGNDPARSVVNRFHRAHDVPNLFVVDGSSFVTSGRQQPTATIQALAYRAADFIAGAATRGELG